MEFCDRRIPAQVATSLGRQILLSWDPWSSFIKSITDATVLSLFLTAVNILLSIASQHIADLPVSNLIPFYREAALTFNPTTSAFY